MSKSAEPLLADRPNLDQFNCWCRQPTVNCRCSPATCAGADDLTVVRVIDSMTHEFVSAGAPGKVVDFERVARKSGALGMSPSGGNGK